jgi:hypothetical protein
MSDPHPGGRRFSEKEVAAILRRTAELQAARSAEGGVETTSLAQLQQAAAELGIPPALVAEAAAQVDQPPAESVWGGPWRTTLEQEVPARVGEDEWPALVETVRRVTGRMGLPVRSGSAFEWTSSSPDVLHVTVTPAAEGSRVRVRAKYGDWGGAIYGGTLLATFCTGAALLATAHLPLPLDMGLAVAGMAGALAVSRAGFNRVCAWKRRRAEQLMGALMAQLAPVPAQAEAQAVASVAVEPELLVARPRP